MNKILLTTLVLALGVSTSAQAFLVPRTGGMVYDTVNNITWAADANLFQTQAASNPNLVNEIIAANGGVIHNTPNYYDNGTHTLTTADFDATWGELTWYGAKAWANSLMLGGVKGWSLPTIPNPAVYENNYGFGITTSQMGDLFYIQLGGAAWTDIATTHNDSYKLFTNVRINNYWSGSEGAGSEYAPLAAFGWSFSMTQGKQELFPKPSSGVQAWAVHSGDVAAPINTPSISTISPAYGVTAGSTAVTLTGSGFTGATAVSLGGTAATNVTVVSDTSLTATTAAHAAGAASVLVTTIGGTNAANSLFSYTNCGPGLPLTTGIGALWQMLALPCVPTTGTIAGVFGTGTSSNLSTVNYATATPGIGWIIEDRTVGAVPAYRPFLTSDISLNVGTGYWLKSYQAPTNGLLTMDGTTTPTDVTPAQGCASANGCKAITVTTIKGSNRYNLVGNPFAYPIDWSKVRVRVDNSALTLTPVAANSAGYISNNVNIWNGTTYDSFNDVSPTQGNLQYFKSFFVNVLPGAFGHTIELLIPAEQSTLSRNQALPANPEQLATLEMPWYLGWLDWVVSPAAAAPVPAVSDHVNPQILAKPTDWYIRLKVDNPVTGWKDRGALLGQLSDAKTGFDGHDIPKMAPFSTPYLTLVFPHPDWGTTNAADYASDFHPVDLNAHSWSFEIRANPVGSKVFLSWEGSPALLKRSQLLEVATGKIILPTDPLWTIKGYPLTLNAAVQRYVWQVSAQ